MVVENDPAHDLRNAVGAAYTSAVLIDQKLPQLRPQLGPLYAKLKEMADAARSGRQGEYPLDPDELRHLLENVVTGSETLDERSRAMRQLEWLPEQMNRIIEENDTASTFGAGFAGPLARLHTREASPTT